MRLYKFRLAGPAYYVVAPSYIAAMRLLLLREDVQEREIVSVEVLADETGLLIEGSVA